VVTAATTLRTGTGAAWAGASRPAVGVRAVECLSERSRGTGRLFRRPGLRLCGCVDRRLM
jgi:hypothetical protein